MHRLLVIAALLLSAGCDDMDTRLDPIPVVEVELTAAGGYLIDGRPVADERLDRDLKRRAADAPNEKLGRTRLQVRIVRAPGVDYERVQDLQERCQALGISNVEIPR